MNIFTYKANVLVSLLFLSMTHFGISQNETPTNCGQITSPQTLTFYNSIKSQLATYEQDFSNYKMKKGPVPANIINAVPIKAHIIRNSDGSGGLSTGSLNHAIDNLNLSFENAYLEFFLCDGIDYIDSDVFSDFRSGDEDALKETNYVPGVINIYFVDNLTNASEDAICGYSDNTGRNDVVVMKTDCAINGSSLAHEMGHFFSLLHTHGPSNNTLTTELVNGSNCDTDGDGICDTPADPRLTASNVDSSCNYIGDAVDANGDAFMPDTNNIMSYSRKNCRTVFSNQQSARMYAYYMAVKNYLACPSFNANIAVNESETCEASLTVNFESLSENATNWQWDIDADGVIDYTTQNPTHTYETGIYDVILTVTNDSKSITRQFINYIKVGSEIEPLFEDFEDFEMTGKHGWSAIDTSGKGYNWLASKGLIHSKGTGPKQKSGSVSNTYIFAEASGVEAGAVAEFISPCFYVEFENSELEFGYHMFGKRIGELHIDLKTEDGYINDIIPALVGGQQQNQDDDFLTTSVNLSAYTGQNVKIRFRAVRGSGWDGDIAIDNISVNIIYTAITDDLYTVYPNPAKDNIIYIKNKDPKNISTFSVMNLMGQEFLRGTITNRPIDVSSLSSGTYLLTISDGKSRILKKIIK
ncbi:T9SS type A sorting domain-containing protein [Algibacter sp. 2305UL17-15]|uniref:T9SS-dependent choice-of-anchor J family protein n=1 Tax=Algibacter sp. 2305UL17-15 TaxID=3231268 RepID=UPI0034589650